MAALSQHRTPPTTGPTTEPNNQPTEPAEPTRPNADAPPERTDPKSRGAGGATAQRPPGPARPHTLTLTLFWKKQIFRKY